MQKGPARKGKEDNLMLVRKPAEMDQAHACVCVCVRAGGRAHARASRRARWLTCEYSLCHLRQPKVGTKAPKHRSSNFKFGTEVSKHWYDCTNGCAHSMPVVAQ